MALLAKASRVRCYLVVHLTGPAANLTRRLERYGAPATRIRRDKNSELSLQEDFALLCTEAFFGDWGWSIFGLIVDVIGFLFLLFGAIGVATRTRQLWEIQRHVELLNDRAKRVRSGDEDTAETEARSLEFLATRKLGEGDIVTTEGIEKEKSLLQFGGTLVVVGFLFQIVGAWPCQ